MPRSNPRQNASARSSPTRLRIHRWGSRDQIKRRVGRNCWNSWACHRRHVEPLTPHEFLRRPAAADRPWPGPWPCTPRPDHRGRAGVGPGRLDPARRLINLLDDLQGRAEPDLYLHRPRPRRGAARVRPDRGDVSRQDRGDLTGRGTVQPRPIHPYTDGAGCPRCRSRTPTCPSSGTQIVLEGDRAQPHNIAAEWMAASSQPRLPVRDGDLRRAGAAAGGTRERRPHGGPATNPLETPTGLLTADPRPVAAVSAQGAFQRPARALRAAAARRRHSVLCGRRRRNGTPVTPRDRAIRLVGRPDGRRRTRHRASTARASSASRPPRPPPGPRARHGRRSRPAR